MTGGREEILARVAAALDRPVRPAAPHRVPVRAGDVELLARRIEEYGATVSRAGSDREVAAAVEAALVGQGAAKVLVPPGLPTEWRQGEIEWVEDDPPLPYSRLASADAVVSGCALAAAETGTLVLDGGPTQGRRVLTLLPDLHVCVVLAEDTVADVPDAIFALAHSGRPVTFISGPSATSDIELNRVEGVHGPRRLKVVLRG